MIAKSISVTDTAGNARKTLAAGSDFVAVVQIANDGSQPRRYVTIIEVIDASGITVSLDLRNGVLAPGQMASASSTLRLGEGDYSLYAFAVDDDKNPQSFSPVVSSPVSISKIHYPGIYVPLHEYPDLSNPDGIWIPYSRQNMITMMSCS